MRDHAFYRVAPGPRLGRLPEFPTAAARRLARGCAGLLLCGILFHAPAFALDRADIEPLAGDDFDAKAAAIDKLVANGDAPSQRLLQALKDDAVSASGDGQLFIQDGEDSLDAVTDQKKSAPADAQPVSLSNVLRSKVEAAVSAVGLASPDLATRRAAVEGLLRSPDDSFKPLIDRARASETDAGLRARLDTLWALTALHDHDAKRRLEAVRLINARHNLQMAELLRPLLSKDASGAFAEPDPAVRAAAQSGLAELDSLQRRSEIAGTIFAGLSLGSVLLLAALGLAITYGLIGVINMAHGEFLMIGAYATFTVQNLFRHYAPGLFDWYLVAALPAAFLSTALLGAVLERVVLKHLYGRPLETLLTTFGVSLLLMQSVRTLFGAQNVQVSNPSWMSGGVAVLPNLILPYNRLVILAFSLGVIVLAWAVLNRTRLGLFVRAVTQNRRMAACVGIRTGAVDSYAFAFGAGIAGLGGCALSQIGNVGPDLGQSYIIDSFMSVVLGGVGQLAGTIVGSFGLGLANKAIEPFWGAVLAKIAVLVLVVLFIQKRPQGLFALKGRSAEA